MIPRDLKAAYYLLVAIPLKLNGKLYKLLRAPRYGCIRVHLGPGLRNYLPGWINVDANLITAKIDVWADLRNPLPFHNDTVDVFYSYHVIEHLPERVLSFHFSEMIRCLKPNGVVRIGAPHGDNAIRKFLEGDYSWFPDWPESRKSMGGRFNSFIFCRGEHHNIITRSFLEDLLSTSGFHRILTCNPRTETAHPGVIDYSVLSSEEHEDCPDVPHTLIIEAVKPKEK